MNLRGAVVDLDGTVWRGAEVIPGAEQGIRALREAGLDVCFVTNNPTCSPAAVAERLATAGIDADPADVVTSGAVTAAYLSAHHADDPTFVVGEEGLIEQLSGVRRTATPADAGVVVVSVDREFTFDDLAGAQAALADGETALVGTDPDTAIPGSDGTTLPGTGSVLAAVEAAAGREADAVVGKPSAHTVAATSDRLDVPPEECVVIGDRLDTDVQMGNEAGMHTALVLTGVTTAAEADLASIEPDHVVQSLATVDEILPGRRSR